MNRLAGAAVPGIRTILLVDDQAFVGMAVARLLATEHDLHVQNCTDATAALDRANELRPNLILQDLVMPGLDGVALVKMYRENPATSRTPVIVLSGNDDDATRARALDAGASDYLVKLPSGPALVSCLRRHLDGTGGVTPSSRQNGSDAIDGGALADVSSAPMVLDRFLAEVGAELDALRDASVRSDQPAMRQIAHRMKGAAAIVGARPLAVLCERLEQDPISILATAVAREVSRVRDTHSRDRAHQLESMQ